MLLLSLIFSFLATSQVRGLGCPRQEDILPCRCRSDGSINEVICVDIDNEDDLEGAMVGIRGRDIYSVRIVNSTFTFMKHDLFKDTTIEELELENTAFMSISDTEVAFEGLEEHLAILLITECHMMNSWNWSYLKKLKKLFRLDILVGDLISVDEDISEIGHLPITDVAMSKNAIEFVHEKAFETFNDLFSLTLNDNQISELKRSMLPNPAENLYLLDFSYNNIRYLPTDFFTNMPSLRTLDLNGNQLVTLEENVYSPILGQLEIFGAMSKVLRCDCRLTWLTKIKLPETTRAVCSAPPAQKGKFIQHLEGRELHCFWWNSMY